MEVKCGSRISQAQCKPNSKESNPRSSQKLETLLCGQRREEAPLRISAAKIYRWYEEGIAIMGWEMIKA